VSIAPPFYRRVGTVSPGQSHQPERQQYVPPVEVEEVAAPASVVEAIAATAPVKAAPVEAATEPKAEARAKKKEAKTDPVVEEKAEEPALEWNDGMRKAELAAIAEGAGLVVGKDTKAQIIKKLEAL